MLRSSLHAFLLCVLIAASPSSAAEKEAVKEDTPEYSIEASLPELRDVDQVLANKLKADLMLQLEAFRHSATAEKKMAEKEKYPFRQYVLTVNWGVELYTNRLLSLIKTDWSFRGGAHGNTVFESLLFDRKSRTIIGLEHLFGGSEKDARAALRQYVIEDLLKQKAKRDGKSAKGYEDSFVREGVNGRFRTFSAEPSTSPGKAAGLRIWYGPYDVGAYVEGPFESFVPHQVFSPFLTGDYKDVFAGKSARK